MPLEVMLQHLRPGAWHARMSSLLEELRCDGAALDEVLDPDGRNYLAAGVYSHSLKDTR